MKALLCSGLLLLPVVAVQAQDDHALLDQTASDLAANRTPAADELTDEEQAARAQLAIAQARLELIAARKALTQDQVDVAAGKARQVLTLLGTVTIGDAEALRLQAEGVLARLARTGRHVAGTQQTAPPTGLAVDVTRRIAEEYTGAVKPELPTDPATWSYNPGRQLVDTERVFERDRQRLYYEGSLREAIRSDELRRLVEAEEARVAPSQDIAFPPDWQQRTARRARYEGGEIARSESRTGPDGQEWFVSIYDISDLTYEPPNFTNAPVLDLWESYNRAQNLDALRRRSFIFGGYPEDLAAGLPLLGYLGGTNLRQYSGPVYSAERQARIVNMIQAFTEQQDGAFILSQPGRP